jgi:nucleoid DNA-binding protein
MMEQGRTTEASAGKSSNALQQPLQMGINTLIGLVAGRTDISDLNLEKIVSRLKAIPDQVSEQANRTTTQLQGKDQEKESYNPIRIDVERYLLDTYSWQMTPERVAKDFRNLLYDPDADPETIANQLSALDRSYFVEVLTSRGVFTQSRIQQLADTLEHIRREVIEAAHIAREREIALDLRQRVGAYLTLASREQLYQLDHGVLPDFKAVLTDADANYATLQQRLASYDRETFRQILWQRQDITPEEAEVILNALESTRDRVLEDAQSSNQQFDERMIALRQAIENYLRYSDKAELTPDGIKQNLTRILSDSQLNISSLRYRAFQWNRETLLNVLSQRGDINEAEAYQIVDQVESKWNRLLTSPGALAGMAKNQYDQTLNLVSDYLRRTNLQELNPEGIQRDLTQLLDNPKEGSLALRRRLSQIDRETLVRLLSQREDLSEAQINHTLDQLEEGIRRIVKTPRRLALRAQQQVMDFESSLEDYLRNTDKEELNPEGIKRDLRLLAQSPQLGWQNLSDRLARMDRSTLTALLSQRKDITPEDAERIVLQIESVRDQLLDQMRQIQYRIQELIDRILNKIRDYLNALNRSELNYDHIKQDISKLFDDPQAGFESLRDRLRHFDRGTLVALLSSTRKDISEADANRIIDQIEGARNNVLQRAERIQIETQRRLEEVKLQAQRQMEETRKAAATAAWWLFATALVSAIASAGAGAIASY